MRSSIFDYLKTGGGGGGGTGGDVEMTEKQKQGMQQIERNNEEIDELADVLSDGTFKIENCKCSNCVIFN